MIDFIKYIILGFLQGVAEVLPISSSGHLAITKVIMGIESENLAFEVFLHMASLIAVLLYLRKPIMSIVTGCFKFVFKKDKGYKFEFLYFLMLVVSTIPVVTFTVIIKLLGYDASPLYIIGICLVINAIMLFVLSRLSGDKTKEEMTFKDAVVIGIFQCAGVFPGISRSGSCLSGAFTRKINKKDAADYAFMLFIPAVLGAFVLEASNISLIFNEDLKSLICYFVAFLVSMVTTYFAFDILLKAIKNGKLTYFSIYCTVVGILTFIYSALNGWI